MAQQPAKPAEGEAAAEAAPKKSKKMFVIIGLVVLLAAGGGGAAWFMMHGKKEDPHKKEEKHAEEEKPPVFVPLETFTVNLQGDKYLQVDITVEAKDDKVGEFIKAQMPNVRNRILILLTSKTAEEITTGEGKKQLADDILKQLKEPFSAGGKPLEVNGVLFTSFVVQ